MTDGEVLREALDWLGPDGERWLKGRLVQFGRRYRGMDEPVKPIRVCMEGAIRIALWGNVGAPIQVGRVKAARFDRILRLLVQVVGEQFPDLEDEFGEQLQTVPEFNDALGITFPDVRVVFEKAISIEIEIEIETTTTTQEEATQ